MEPEPVESSGCLLCGTTRRPLRCAACVNKELADKRQHVMRAVTASDALRQRLTEALAAKEQGQQQQRQLEQAAQAHAQTAARAAAARQRLAAVRKAVADLEQQTAARRAAVAMADKQLAARRSEVLGAVVPDMLRTKNLQLGLVLDQLVDEQRAKLLTLQEILPLTITPAHGGAPGNRTGRPPAAASAAKPPRAQSGRSSGGGGSSSTADSSRPLVAVAGRRLPEGLAGVGADAGQEAQELGSALGYVLLFLDLAAAYLASPLLHQSQFQGSWSSLWQPPSFNGHGPASPSARLRLSFAPVAAPGPAAAAKSPPRMPRKPAANPVQTMTALAQQSYRSLRGVAQAGYQAYSGAGTTADAAAAASPAEPPSEEDVRAAEVALGRALHLLHRSIGAVVADQLGPLRKSPPEWGAFAALAALTASALRPPRQEQRTRAPAGLYVSAAASMLAAGGAGNLAHHPGGDSRIVGVSTLFPPDGDAADGTDGWDLVARPGMWGGGGGFGGGLPLLPPPPSQPEAVEHWTRALILDTHSPESGEQAATWRGALQQGFGAFQRELAPRLAAVAARLPQSPSHLLHGSPGRTAR